MTTQPTALRLADELLDGMNDEHWNQLNAVAAAMLRRQHALLRQAADMLTAMPVKHPQQGQERRALLEAIKERLK